MGNIITGTGIHVPDDVVTNADLTRLMDTSEEWIVSRTGVKERRLAPPGVAASDLAVGAAGEALARAGLAPDAVDALVVATMTPDFYAPGSAPLVQHKLGLGDVTTYGIRQQCSGFIYGLDLADALLTAGKADTALVVGTEVHAGIQPWAESWRELKAGVEPSPETWERNSRYRGWAVLFGDGAGAVVLQRGKDRDVGLLSVKLHTDGEMFDLIHVPALGSADQPLVDAASVARDEHMPTMNGPRLYRQAVRKMPEVVAEALEAAGRTVDDVDIVVAHQANSRIVEGVRKALGLDPDTVPMNLDRYGNTTAGTLPILYHELKEAGRIEPGDLVCFVAFGAGAHWGAAIYQEPDEG